MILLSLAPDAYERLSPSVLDATAPTVAVFGLCFLIGYALANIREAPRGRRRL